MKMVLASDHAGFDLKETIKKFLIKKDLPILDVGCHGLQSVDYPDFGALAGQAILEKEASLGIIICGTGIGISLAANKVKGVRAALCHNEFTARMARQHNDANILALGSRVIGEGLAIEMVNVFLETTFEGGRHQRRVDKIMALEK